GSHGRWGSSASAAGTPRPRAWFLRTAARVRGDAKLERRNGPDRPEKAPRRNRYLTRHETPVCGLQSQSGTDVVAEEFRFAYVFAHHRGTAMPGLRHDVALRTARMGRGCGHPAPQAVCAEACRINAGALGRMLDDIRNHLCGDPASHHPGPSEASKDRSA